MLLFHTGRESVLLLYLFVMFDEHDTFLLEGFDVRRLLFHKGREFFFRGGVERDALHRRVGDGRRSLSALPRRLAALPPRTHFLLLFSTDFRTLESLA